MDLKLISALIDKVNASGLKSLEIEENGLRIRLENAFPAMTEREAVTPLPPAHPASVPVQAEQDAEEDSADIITITAPIVGVFYSLEECGKTALSAGDRIEEGQVVCAIEAMKLINEVESTAAGAYVETLVKPGDQVEFGQPLMKIRKG